MGMSENRVYSQWDSHLINRDNDQQNHWVQWGLANIFRHTHIMLTMRMILWRRIHTNIYQHYKDPWYNLPNVVKLANFKKLPGLVN